MKGIYVCATDTGVGKTVLSALLMRYLKYKKKKAKYLRSFTIYVLDQQIYSGDVADALEKDLNSLSDNRFILGISKYDTNPDKNPQMPAKYRTSV